MKKNEPVWARLRADLLSELWSIEERRRVIRQQLRSLGDTIGIAQGIDGDNAAEAQAVEAAKRARTQKRTPKEARPVVAPAPNGVETRA